MYFPRPSRAAYDALISLYMETFPGTPQVPRRRKPGGPPRHHHRGSPIPFRRGLGRSRDRRPAGGRSGLLGLQVVFVSEFVDGRRVFRHIESQSSALRIQRGQSAPLEQTICQRILDGRLPIWFRASRMCVKSRDCPPTSRERNAHRRSRPDGGRAGLRHALRLQHRGRKRPGRARRPTSGACGLQRRPASRPSGWTRKYRLPTLHSPRA